MNIYALIQSPGCIINIMSKVKAIFKRSDERMWLTELWNDKNKVNGSKLRTYRLNKKDLETEPYLRHIMSRKKRKVLSKY